MSGSSSVVSLLPRGAVPYCSTWCSLCCLAAQPRLTTSSDRFRVFSFPPTVAARVRFLAPSLNGFQRFAILLYSLFLFLRAACTPFADAPQRPRRRLILHAYAYPWRAPRARPPPHLPLRGSNSRPPAPIPGDQGFCLRRHRALVLPWCGAAAVPLLNKL